MPGEAISIVCPSCGARSDNAPAGLVGRNVRCPRCSVTFRVEAAAPHLPAAVATVVDRAIADDPDRRYPTAAELRDALREAID